MKHFLIKYRRQDVPEAEWHADIARFIAALDAEPAVRGKISYRCLKARGGNDYYHLATAADEAAVKALQSQAFFARYTELTKHAGGGAVEVVPLELIAETQHRA